MALGLGMVSVANAQYAPQKGDFATEIGFAPFHSKGNDGKTFKLNEGMFKVRYFLTDKDALRLKLGVGIDNSSDDNTETNFTSYPNESESTTTTETNSKKTEFKFALGYERHFKTIKRLDIYAGAEFGYSTTSYSGDKSTYTVSKNYQNNGDDKSLASVTTTNSMQDYSDRNPEGQKSVNEFFGAVFAGADFYIYKGLYLGAELGLKFSSGKNPDCFSTEDYSSVIQDAKGKTLYSEVSKKYNGVEIFKRVTQSDGTVTETKNDNVNISSEKTTTKLEFYVEPAIRLGWRF